MVIPANSMPWSRLTLTGQFTLEAPLRISGGPEGLALDGEGNPVIPASTFRGALRATVESALRGLADPQQETRYTVTLRGPDGRPTPTTRTVKICCDSVDKRDDDLHYQGCLTGAIVNRWQADTLLRPQLDSALIECTCQVCRLFGTPWIAGRVYLADLPVIKESWNGTFVTRGGLSISRDTDTAIEGSLYQRQAVPAGTRFQFHLVVENASDMEQGMILLALRTFELGWVTLGSDRARGLGRGRLVIDWWNCRYVDSEHLIGALLVGTDPQVFAETDAEARINALAAGLRAP